jgi:hypothetical protein
MVKFTPKTMQEDTRKEQLQKGEKIDKSRNQFLPDDFTFDLNFKFYICPAGKRMYRSGIPTVKGVKRASFALKMKSKIDSVIGKAIYSRRITTAEPPFAHIRHVMGLDRFTLRGKTKVNNQWLLFCIVHNLKKMFKYGMEATI